MALLVILVSQAHGLTRLRFVCDWMACDLFNIDKLQELSGQMISTAAGRF